ncbi:MAG: leucine-rich repeat domain-containing protein [Candidatus Gracilibacteria bacterium]|nr:leucine-rich repeat domain-containing protein [Candidatus Gracilibacteria bacterium]
MKKNNKAFTLVELIVVITILAILGTIAFINLQGYSVSARDGKRVSDINNIMKKIGIESSKGTSLSTLITTTKTNSGLTINGQVGSSIQGTANFLALKEDGNSFKDPVTKGDYVLSYSVGGSGTGAYKFNQVSTVNEEENTAVVKGNYYLMQPSDSPSIIYNPDSTYFVVDGGVDLPYVVQEGTLVNNTPPPVVCNYDQADIDVLNTSGANGDLEVYDIDWNILPFPLTVNQWCDDVDILVWYGGSIIESKVYTLIYLKHLVLESNSLTTLSTQIGNLTNLQTLTLAFNSLTTLPTQIGNLTNLQYLYLNDNSLTTLPTQIGNLTNLQELYLSANGLTTLPTQIGNLVKLKYLYLDYNLLTTLPIEIGNLINLEYLELDSNGITTLPTQIGNLTSLQSLYLYDNSLTTLPTQIGNLTSLQNLYLNNNSITTIPTEIGNLTNLGNLYLNNNSITTIPTEIGNLTNLYTLALSHNSLTGVIPSEIGNLTNLGNLFLDSTNISTLPAEIVNLTNLTNLYLSGNIGLGQLSTNYWNFDVTRSQSGIPIVGQTMTISKSSVFGSKVIISITSP